MGKFLRLYLNPGAGGAGAGGGGGAAGAAGAAGAGGGAGAGSGGQGAGAGAGGGQGGGQGAGGGDSVSAVVDHQNPQGGKPTYTAPTLDMKTAIPPALRDKPYMQKITSFEQLVTEFDNLQTFLGKRPGGIPAPTASAEEVQTFYSNLRPKEAKEYEIPETEYQKKYGKDDKFQEAMRGAFHEAGLSKHQAKVLAEKYDGILMQSRAAQETQRAADDKKFDERLDQMFGGEKQKALDRAKNLMVESIPDDLKPLVANLPVDALLVLTTTLNKVHDKYIKEDSFGGGNNNAGGDAQSLRTQALEIMRSKEYRDFREPGHEAAKQKVVDIYKQIAAINGQS